MSKNRWHYSAVVDGLIQVLMLADWRAVLNSEFVQGCPMVRTGARTQHPFEAEQDTSCLLGLCVAMPGVPQWAHCCPDLLDCFSASGQGMCRNRHRTSPSRTSTQ